MSLAALVVFGEACARFGFERLDPDPDAAIDGWLVTAGANGQSNVGLPEEAATDGGGRPRADAAAEDAAGSCSDGARNGDEAGLDCGGTRCLPCACSLGVPERLGEPNYAGNDLWSPKLSGDGLSLYFGLTVPGLSEQIAVSTRPARTDPFGLGQALPGPVNQGKQGTPYLSLDGLSLYFYSERTGGAGNRDLYVATRQSGAEAFDGVTHLSSLNTSALDYQPWLGPDELTIYFASGPAGSCDIVRATRTSIGAAFGPPEVVTELSTPSDEGGIALSSDGLEAILTSNRPGGAGARDLYLATRASTSQPFSVPEQIAVLNTPENDIDPAFSPDGSELYFATDRGGGSSELYRSERRCAR